MQRLRQLQAEIQHLSNPEEVHVLERFPKEKREAYMTGK
jgi:hypothetical protein